MCGHLIERDVLWKIENPQSHRCGEGIPKGIYAKGGKQLLADSIAERYREYIRAVWLAYLISLQCPSEETGKERSVSA